MSRGGEGEILLNIIIDGAGYVEGASAFSFYGLPDELGANTKEVMMQYDRITEGAQWPQGDHSIFIQNGVPAMAAHWYREEGKTDRSCIYLYIP